MRDKGLAKRRYGTTIRTAAVSLVFMTALLAALLLHSSQTRQHALARAEQILLDSAAEQGRALRGTLDGQYTVLEVLAATFGSTGQLTPERILPQLALAEQASPFNRIILDLPDGSTYLSDGRRTNVADRLYFQQSMTGVRSIEYVPSALVAGTPLVILSVPVRSGGQIIGVVHGSYAESHMRALIVPGAYGSQGGSFICDERGNVLLSSTHDAAGQRSSFVAALKSGGNQGEAARVAADLTSGLPGRVSYRGQTGGRCAVYAPLELVASDSLKWFIVNEIPANLIDLDVAAATSTSLVALLLISVAAAAAIAFFIWREAFNKRKLDREMDELALREEQYRIVAQQSGKNICRYDIGTHVLFRDKGDDGFGRPQRIENVPESIMELYAEESRDEYRAFFRRIWAGEPTASVVSRMRDGAGSRRWVHSDATVIFDAAGKPAQAIISCYDVTEQRERELLYQKWQQERASIPSSTAMVLECDLTHNTTDHIEGSLPDWVDTETNIGFNERMRLHLQAVAPDDRTAFAALADRERLIGAFCNGVYTHSLDYRMCNSGEPRWVNITIQLAQYPDTNDIKAFLVVKDIDEQKRAELALRATSETDCLTGALNRASFISRVNQILSDGHAATHALIILDIDDLKQINDTLGHQQGDSALVALVQELRRTIRERDLIGRIGGDEFMVLLKNVTQESARTLADAICRRMLLRRPSGIHMSVSLGVSLYPKDGADFTELYKNADMALYRSKRAGKNRSSLFCE